MQIVNIEQPKINRSVGVAKSADNFNIFSKNLTINTMIITLMILFFNWSKLLIFKVESENFPFAKSISLIKSSYTPNPKINNTIPIKNKSMDEMMPNSKSLLFVMVESNKGFLKIMACNISQLPIMNNAMEETIDNITDSITIYLKLQSPFSNLFSKLGVIKILFLPFIKIASKLQNNKAI